jgi:hypothetical protein
LITVCYLPRLFAVAIAGFGCLTLAACGSSDDTAKLHLHPAVGTISGVVGHGTSVDQDPLGKGRQYNCSPGLRASSLDMSGTVNYNGTDIQESDDTVNTSDKDGTFFYQTKVTIKLRNNLQSFGSKAVNLIVTSLNGFYYTDPKMADVTDGAIDDRAVNLANLIPSDKKQVIITLDTHDYSSIGYVTGLKVCLHP